MAETEKKHLLSPEEEQKVITAISQAENMSSGEIRVHISQGMDQNPMESTKLIFKQLKMYKTEQRNAVLIHLSFGSKNFAIYGDKGIHQKVGQDFWDETQQIMQQHFIKGEFVKGITKGVLSVGDKLKQYFPYNEGDINELPNEVTYD